MTVGEQALAIAVSLIRPHAFDAGTLRMAESDHQPVEIVFECLPLGMITRLDIPLDASDAYRARCERIKAAIVSHGAKHTYYLYGGHCLFRFANSEVDGSCRFDFDGVVRTDTGDRKTEACELTCSLTSETCGGVPSEVSAWLQERVRQAVAIEFDRFIAAGHIAQRRHEMGEGASLADLAVFAGMDV